MNIEAPIKKGVNSTLDSLEVSGIVRIIDKDGNVRELEIISIEVEEEDAT